MSLDYSLPGEQVCERDRGLPSLGPFFFLAILVFMENYSERFKEFFQGFHKGSSRVDKKSSLNRESSSTTRDGKGGADWVMKGHMNARWISSASPNSLDTPLGKFKSKKECIDHIKPVILETKKKYANEGYKVSYYFPGDGNAGNPNNGTGMVSVMSPLSKGMAILTVNCKVQAGEK